MFKFYILFVITMEKTWWSVTSEYMGWTRQEFLFTYSESEKEENEVNKNNAWLIYEADFYPLYTDFLKLDINATELIVISYLYYWTKKGKRIYTKNEDLAVLTKTSTATITRTIKNLVDKWYISVVEKKLRIGTDRKMQVTTPLIKMISAGNQNDESYNNNKKNKINNQESTKSLSLNKNLGCKLANICKGDLTFTENVIERLEEYNNTRKKKLEKLTDKWFKLVIDKIVKYGHWTEEWMIAVLKQSVENGWEWLYEVKWFKPKVDYEKDLWLFLTRLKTDYEWLKKELGNDKFFELKKKALEYWAVNKLL